MIIFGTRTYSYLVDSILAAIDKARVDEQDRRDAWGYKDSEPWQIPLSVKGAIDAKTFADGEYWQRISVDVRGKDVAIVGGTGEDFMELYDLCCAAVQYGAKRLTIVIPYYSYSTMERATQPGEVVTAKTRARVLSSIPTAANGNRIVMLDLHAPGIPHYFEGSIERLHVYAKPVILSMIGGFVVDAKSANVVLACTDAGRAKWVESLANELRVDAAFVFKRRIDTDKTEVAAVNASVKDRVVMIYDDMIRTGGSLINAAKAYKDAGAAKVYAITTHGIFANDALVKLAETRLFNGIGWTDSHPNGYRLGVKVAAYSCAVRMESVAVVLANALVQ